MNTDPNGTFLCRQHLQRGSPLLKDEPYPVSPMKTKSHATSPGHQVTRGTMLVIAANIFCWLSASGAPPLQPVRDEVFFDPNTQWITKWRQSHLVKLESPNCRFVLALVVWKGDGGLETIAVVEGTQGDAKPYTKSYEVVYTDGTNVTRSRVGTEDVYRLGQLVWDGVKNARVGAQDSRLTLDGNEEIYVFCRTFEKNEFSYLSMDRAIALNPSGEDPVAKWRDELKALSKHKLVPTKK